MTVTAILGQGPSPEELAFQEKMKERMRAAFGDLMPDAVLAGIVAQGIHEAFFKDEVIGSREPWTRDVIKKSWLIAFIQQEAEKQVKDAVAQWVKDHPEAFAAAVKTVLDKGLASAVIGAFDNLLVNEMRQLRQGVGEAIDRVRRG